MDSITDIMRDLVEKAGTRDDIHTCARVTHLFFQNREDLSLSSDRPHVHREMPHLTIHLRSGEVSARFDCDMAPTILSGPVETIRLWEDEHGEKTYIPSPVGHAHGDLCLTYVLQDGYSAEARSLNPDGKIWTASLFSNATSSLRPQNRDWRCYLLKEDNLWTEMHRAERNHAGQGYAWISKFEKEPHTGGFNITVKSSLIELKIPFQTQFSGMKGVGFLTEPQMVQGSSSFYQSIAEFQAHMKTNWKVIPDDPLLAALPSFKDQLERFEQGMNHRPCVGSGIQLG